MVKSLNTSQVSVLCHLFLNFIKHRGSFYDLLLHSPIEKRGAADKKFGSGALSGLMLDY